MLGAIVGDIAGSRFEFDNLRSTDFELFEVGCGFTDDTICTLSIADALLHDAPFDIALHRWCNKYPHPKGAYGGSFARWVQSDNPQPYNSFGNGSAMRVSPCGWVSDDRNTVLELAEQSAECTHNHPEGIKGAVAVADCIWHARKGYSKADIRQMVSSVYGYDLNATCNHIRSTSTFNETCQVTVPQSIVCFLESTDFECAIRLAVSIGGDSDTIAAITGGIAEAFYGIPTTIKQKAMEYLPAEFITVIDNFYKQYGKERVY